MTLREILKTADLNKVYRIINARDNENIAPCDKPTLYQTVEGYSCLVKDLLGKPVVKPHSMPIVIRYEIDLTSKHRYIDACLRNPCYVAPPKGAKPWGGCRGKRVPKGKYNCNADKYNKYFSLIGTHWSKLIDTPIEFESKRISIEDGLAILLWELSFFSIGQLIDIADKYSKPKCGTCEGYGLWFMGDASPMGPQDASGGLPTKACPECGANRNPIKK